MCGIVGYVGTRKATPILIDGLLALEYRGYDSAGIAIIENEDIIVKKEKGRVKNLISVSGIDDFTSSIGIAHTRWATHGKPSNTNSHPHINNSNNIAVVHNGIIENYAEIKDFLISKGYTFYSQTDTEIIPNLIDYHFKNSDIKTSNKLLGAVYLSTKEFKGSYALEVISKANPDEIIIARKDSPLVIGNAKGEFFIASDIPAITEYTNEFYFLNDNEYGVLTKDNITFFDIDLNTISKETKIINVDNTKIDKNGYEDYMLKEIYEQPDAVRKTINSRLTVEKNINFSELNDEIIKNTNNIYIIGCGTAMYAGMVGKTIIENLTRIPVSIEFASEFRYRNPILDNNTLCIFITQSGETADTIAALKLSKQLGAKTIALSNVVNSSITREADISLYTHAGPEVAVASTKAYTSQVSLLATLGIYFAEITKKVDIKIIEDLKQELLSLPVKIESILSNTNEIETFAKDIYNQKDMYFIGRLNDYNACLEGCLKLKEISYIHSDAYPAGELKHGAIALIEDNITVISLITDNTMIEKTISNLQEVITRGAISFVVTNQKLPNNNFDKIIQIPKTNHLIAPILSVIPLQLLAYHITKLKGLDVDKPRNLAKSVTVE